MDIWAFGLGIDFDYYPSDIWLLHCIMNMNLRKYKQLKRQKVFKKVDEINFIFMLCVAKTDHDH